MGPQQSLILMALFNTDQEVTVNDIFDRIERTHSLPSISIALDRMHKTGLVTRRKGDPLPERGGKARLYYRISATGKKALREAEAAQVVVQRLKLKLS